MLDQLPEESAKGSLAAMASAAYTGVHADASCGVSGEGFPSLFGQYRPTSLSIADLLAKASRSLEVTSMSRGRRCRLWDELAKPQMGLDSVRADPLNVRSTTRWRMARKSLWMTTLWLGVERGVEWGSGLMSLGLQAEEMGKRCNFELEM